MKTNMTSIRCNVVTRALGALSLLCVCGLVSVPRAGAQTPYIQTATAANSPAGFDYTDLSRKDSNHDSVYFVTSNWDPGKTGVYNNHPIGVWFDPTHKDWSIFNQDRAAMPLGAAFNVLSVPLGGNVYVHTASTTNSSGDYTFLDNPYTNSNPNALVWVTPNWNPDDISTGVYDNHNIGVWYDGSGWAIFNQDGTAIPKGASFNLIVADGPFYPEAYVHTATPSNSVGDSTFLNNSLINGADGHLLMVTPNWNPDGVGGVYDNHAIGVWYDSNIKRYAIFNQDGSSIPANASFNVWVLK